MSNPSLSLAEPLTLGQTMTPRDTRCSKKVIALLSLLIGLIFATMLLSLGPFTSGDDGQHLASKKPATMLFGSPFAVHPHTGLVAPYAGSRPQVFVNAITGRTKEGRVEGLRNTLESLKSGLVVGTQQSGLKVKETEKLRSKLFEAGGYNQVIKNTLAGLAVAGTKYEELTPMLEGPTALTYTNDPVNTAKAFVEVIKELSDDERLKMAGGSIDGQLLDAKGVTDLSKLQALKESQGKLAGQLKSPTSNIAIRLKDIHTKLARSIKLALAEPQSEQPA